MPIHGYPGNVITANPTAPTSSVATGVWTTEQQLIAVAAGNWPFTIPTQQISRSLRFNSADSAYLNRTLGSSNRRTFTFSAWVKRSLLTSDQHLLGCINFAGGGSTNQQFGIVLAGGDYINVFHYNNGTYQYYPTAALYRDVSSWYHFVIAVDTTQATGSNRVKIYANGVLQATSGAVDISQNTDLFINSGLNTGIGVQVGTGTGNSYYFGGYMAEVYFIDGQQLTPSSFGRTSTTTGVWEPLAYTGTYGTNGFYLNFSDNSNTTAATLGKDYSGNGNNWTPNNFSVTAGAGNDSLVDSPTAYGTDTGVGGSVRGNYATWNAAAQYSGSFLRNGNLDFANSSGTHRSAIGTIGVSSGKWYWEMSNVTDGNCGISSDASTTSSYLGATVQGYGFVYDGNRYNNGSTTSGYVTYSNTDVLGFALDMDAGTLTIYKNGASPVTGVTGLTGTWFPATGRTGQTSSSFNTGQRAFAYTAPSGFKALCTTNLPTPTIGATSTTQADNYFGVALYSGTGSGNSNVVSGLEFTTDLWWQKARNAANNNYLQDAVRGFGASKSLTSNSNGTEGFNGTPLTQSLSVSSTGFTVSGSDFNGNTASETYVAWCWNAGGSTVTNTSGTISAQVRANTTAGFSIVTYTGNGVDGATVGHGLGVVPSMVIQKRRDGSIGGWRVWHSAIYATSGVTSTLYLNLDYASTADGDNISGVSSTTFTTRGTGATNPSGNGCVAYVFTPVAGYSAFGSYTGNAAADGPFIYTGFRPEFVMIKASSSTGDWVMQDVARSPYNVSTNYLVANASTAEQTGQLLDFVSNGFKIRVAVSGAMNGSGTTYIYAAFAESPFKYALAR